MRKVDIKSRSKKRESKSKLHEKLKDGVHDLELQSKKPNQEDSPVTRNIRMLENRLDKALIKFNEAQVIFVLSCAIKIHLSCSRSKKHTNKLSND